MSVFSSIINLQCRTDDVVMGPPSSVIDDSVMEENGSQPATQPLSDSQVGSDIEEQSSITQDDEVRQTFILATKHFYFTAISKLRRSVSMYTILKPRTCLLSAPNSCGSICSTVVEHTPAEPNS